MIAISVNLFRPRFTCSLLKELPYEHLFDQHEDITTTIPDIMEVTPVGAVLVQILATLILALSVMFCFCTLLLTFAKVMIMRWVGVVMPGDQTQMPLLRDKGRTGGGISILNIGCYYIPNIYLCYCLVILQFFIILVLCLQGGNGQCDL